VTTPAKTEIKTVSVPAKNVPAVTLK